MAKRSAKKNEYQSAEQVGVIYARYSTHNQKEESIEQQIAECSDFAAKNGIRIVGIYADKAVSGRSDRRPNFQRMMRDAEKRQFQIVVAYKSNRIARNMLNALQYEARLDLLGIKTLYAKEEFGNTAAGREHGRGHQAWHGGQRQRMQGERYAPARLRQKQGGQICHRA